MTIVDHTHRGNHTCISATNTAFRANGKGLNTISEANLDKNGVSFASSVTNSLLTHRHTTREVNFFKKARVTTFKKEAKPEIVENVFELKREGVSIEDAKHEVRRRPRIVADSGSKREADGGREIAAKREKSSTLMELASYVLPL